MGIGNQSNSFARAASISQKQQHQTLQTINNNNNTTSTTTTTIDNKKKIPLNVDPQQINISSSHNSSYKEDQLPVEEPNNNINNTNQSSAPCYRRHPVSRRGTEFIPHQTQQLLQQQQQQQQSTGGRSLSGSKYIVTQKFK